MNRSGWLAGGAVTVSSRCLSGTSVLYVVPAALVAAIAGSASATPLNVYVSTAMSGANSDIDQGSQRYWNFSTAGAVTDFLGGYFELNKGNSNTTDSIYFSVLTGTYASSFQPNYTVGTGLASNANLLFTVEITTTTFATLPSASGGFTQATFTNPGGSITLPAASSFTAVLWSNAGTTGAQQWSIKGNSPDLFWSDDTGAPITPSGYTQGEDLTQINANSVPATGLAALAGVGLAARRRRR